MNSTHADTNALPMKPTHVETSEQPPRWRRSPVDRTADDTCPRLDAMPRTIFEASPRPSTAMPASASPATCGSAPASRRATAAWSRSPRWSRASTPRASRNRSSSRSTTASSRTRFPRSSPTSRSMPAGAPRWQPCRSRRTCSAPRHQAEQLPAASGERLPSTKLEARRANGVDENFGDVAPGSCSTPPTCCSATCGCAPPSRRATAAW